MKTAALAADAAVQLWTGLATPSMPLLVEAWTAAPASTARPTVVFLPRPRQLDTWAVSLNSARAAFRPEAPALDLKLLPELPEDADEHPQEHALALQERRAVFAQLSARPTAAVNTGARPIVLLTTPGAFFAPAPAVEQLSRHQLHLRAGQTFAYAELQRILAEDFGYSAESVCEHPGQFALRGGLVDVYPIEAEAPVRIDFFGDEVDAIRRFDPTTQRSEAALASVTLSAQLEARDGADAAAGSALDYVPGPCQWVLVEPDELAERYRETTATFERISDTRPGFARVFERSVAGDTFDAFCELDGASALVPEDAPRRALGTASLEPYEVRLLEDQLATRAKAQEAEARKALIKQLAAWQREGHFVTLCAPDAEQLEDLRALVERDGPPGITFDARVGHFAEGLHGGPAFAQALGWPDLPTGAAQGIVLVTDRELTGRKRHLVLGPRRRSPRRAQIDQLLDFSELVDGDPLVHLSHGVCLFRGLQQVEHRGGGAHEEVISLEFADHITLHVPLHEAHLLSRYVGLTKSAPRLAKLGGATWKRQRQEAERATLDLAAELLGTQAQREEDHGHAFAPDSPWQKAFENAFPHQETPDQLTAIGVVKTDMERPRPMDRLLCGDVGFGKTEVALRAAFKAVMDGKQVALLVPTTVLAQQHYQSFRERLSAFPLTVEMLSRFRTGAQQKAILDQVAEGRIDILIGTHRLLSQDLRFRDLGLLVVDEEHRFGVRHKERLKQMRGNVDVLAMSATPIPRTLYLALMGARDLSVIETAPVDRKPIQTLVRGYDSEVVRRAIRHELERGGQVFYLHNRVQSIDAVARRLRELVPEARIAVGHGQMTEHRLEKVMTSFVRGDYDLLVCTTIIENGLDIPNCNTLIIEGADRFGLAQLYQLRGRVGRFNRQAYAYLLLHRHARLVDVARQRLSALRQHNQLGAGFKIALRDLELRGAGNLLGPQQSGHIASVGFDLYCQLLRQSVDRLQGRSEAQTIRASVNLDFITLSAAAEAQALEKEPAPKDPRAPKTGAAGPPASERLEAGVPTAYVVETRLRLDIYRRLALASTLEAVAEVGEELKDRFGPLPEAAEHLLMLTRLRIHAEAAGLRSVESDGVRLKCLRASGKRDDFLKLGDRFPRLSSSRPEQRLAEIEQFLIRQRPSP